jgi:hypothetical protein
MKISGAQVRIRSCIAAAVALGATAAVLADTAMDVALTTVVQAFAGQPDVPRSLTVKGNDANVAGNVTIDGTDAEGHVIQEVIALAGAAVVNGNKAFKTITKITLPHYAVANTERVRVGTGAKLGLPVRLSRNTVIAAFLANVREAVAPTVAADAANLESNTVTLASALNGTAVIVDLYETQ